MYKKAANLKGMTIIKGDQAIKTLTL